MARRTGYKSGMELAVADLKKNYSDYKKEFESFFPDIIAYVAALEY
jgi:acyl carrier protein phosphodiesterase